MLAARAMLPGEADSSSAYETIAEHLLADPSAFSLDLLRSVLAEAFRRRTTASADLAAGLDTLIGALQAVLTERRLAAASTVVAAEGRAVASSGADALGQDGRTSGRARTRVPLRRQILETLTLGPRGSTEIAGHLRTPLATVSRLLRPLAEERLVVRVDDPDDRRRRVYQLTSDGEAWLGRHAASGPAPEPPPGPSDEATAAFLGEALQEAIRRRRHEHHLDDALGRLDVIVREAAKSGVGGVELRARRERATTLRQAGDRRGLARELSWLARAARGDAVGRDPALVVPALGHLQYELGRRSEELGGDGIAGRTALLLTAGVVYGVLEKQGAHADDWTVRRAWALYSVADNFRQLTDMRRALSIANQAAELFAAAGDVYGIAHCLFLAGFALRLRGDFAGARTALDRGHELAAEHGFARLRASTLLQLGETRRCEGHLDEAHDVLRRAYDGARAVESGVGTAFALSALGATAFGRGEPARAVTLFDSAHRLFEERGHREGLALNLRRCAVAERMLVVGDRRPDIARVRQLVVRAQRRYTHLRSPAGVTACLIESGRLAMVATGRATDAGRRLRRVLEPQEHREMLERDPWVPSMLAGFAADAEDAALVEVSRRILVGARERASSRDTAHWQFLHDQIGAPAPKRQKQQRRAVIDEMAGEPRRISDLGDVAVLARAAA